MISIGESIDGCACDAVSKSLSMDFQVSKANSEIRLRTVLFNVGLLLPALFQY